LDQRGNVQTDGYMTGIFAAAAIDRYLMGRRL